MTPVAQSPHGMFLLMLTALPRPRDPPAHQYHNPAEAARSRFLQQPQQTQLDRPPVFSTTHLAQNLWAVLRPLRCCVLLRCPPAAPCLSARTEGRATNSVQALTSGMVLSPANVSLMQVPADTRISSQTQGYPFHCLVNAPVAAIATAAPDLKLAAAESLVQGYYFGWDSVV